MAKARRSFLLLALLGVGGLLLLIAAERLGRPWLIGPGLLLFALGTFAAGADAILRRHSADVHETSATRTFTGPAAVLTGLVLVILSLAFAAAGVAFLVGAQDRLAGYLLARPGVALIGAGAAGVSGGVARVLGAREWRGSVRGALTGVAERTGGMLLLLLGVALLGLGVFETARPAAFDDALGALLEPIRAVTR
jgi:hypothetical protein